MVLSIFIFLLLFIHTPVSAIITSPLLSGGFTYDTSVYDYLGLENISSPNYSHLYLFVAKENSVDGGPALACHFNNEDNANEVCFYTGSGTSDTQFCQPFRLENGQNIECLWDGNTLFAKSNGRVINSHHYQHPGTNNHYLEIYNSGPDLSFAGYYSSPVGYPTPIIPDPSVKSPPGHTISQIAKTKSKTELHTFFCSIGMDHFCE